jgi:hypothetical protein
MLFSERIERRYEMFWNTRRLGPHGKGRCLLTYMSRDDPLEKWHCCDLWQRKLANKWNSREFAVKHGCRVPELYWSGRNVGRIPFDSLPDRYVLRPVVGHSNKGVFVMVNGVNLHDGRRYTEEQLIAELRKGLHPLTRRRVMVEEFICPEGGGALRPLELSLFVFGSRITAIQLEIPGPIDQRGWDIQALDENWQPLPQLHRRQVSRGQILSPPPACFEEMKSQARALGEAYETFLRVDFYASDAGSIFGEFAATPYLGSGFTEFGNRHLGDVWQETFPDRI